MEMEKSKCVVRVVGPNEIKLKNVASKEKESACFINVTSRSTNKWCHDLSPFYLGPCELYDGIFAKNMENAWQYSKVYKNQVDNDRNPNDVWHSWSTEGWNKQKADRWPMGKDAIPLYSYWGGQKLDYVTARKKIYCPLYAESVVKTEGYKKLKNLYETEPYLYIWDFDGYDYLKMGRTLDDVLNDPKKKMGHGFVLAMLLADECAWK